MIALDPRLKNDCSFVEKLTLCQLLLMNDATYPWMILVPDRPDLKDFHDLEAEDHLAVMAEITLVSRILQDLFEPDKINVAALGNMVGQLHIHVIARQKKDPAWPGPVWGAVPATPYDEASLQLRLDSIRQAITDHSAGAG